MDREHSGQCERGWERCGERALGPRLEHVHEDKEAQLGMERAGFCAVPATQCLLLLAPRRLSGAAQVVHCDTDVLTRFSSCQNHL